MSDYKELKEKAEKASPGPWTAHDNHGVRYVSNGKDGRFAKFENRICEASFNLHHPPVVANMEYIAAASPDVVLALIARVEELEAFKEFAMPYILKSVQLRISQLIKRLKCSQY